VSLSRASSRDVTPQAARFAGNYTAGGGHGLFRGVPDHGGIRSPAAPDLADYLRPLRQGPHGQQERLGRTGESRSKRWTCFYECSDGRMITTAAVRPS
jgi:hypothetical protein